MTARRMRAFGVDVYESGDTYTVLYGVVCRGQRRVSIEAIIRTCERSGGRQVAGQGHDDTLYSLKRKTGFSKGAISKHGTACQHLLLVAADAQANRRRADYRWRGGRKGREEDASSRVQEDDNQSSPALGALPRPR